MFKSGAAVAYENPSICWSMSEIGNGYGLLSIWEFSLRKSVRNLPLPSGLGMKKLGAAQWEPSISSITSSLHSCFSSHLMVSLWIRGTRILCPTVRAYPQMNSRIIGVVWARLLFGCRLGGGSSLEPHLVHQLSHTLLLTFHKPFWFGWVRESIKRFHGNCLAI